jgi:hypothetical protein
MASIVVLSLFLGVFFLHFFFFFQMVGIVHAAGGTGPCGRGEDRADCA